MIKLKKVPSVEGILSPTCYKCHKYQASFYLVRKLEGRDVDIPLCNVCLNAYLNYLDDQMIKWAYDLTHDDEGVEL